MMQHQIAEQNQAGCQPSGQQQMVLCPVRVVYETQMLVQPGDQIQPNQTIFINPQNPPPWAQNRQPQNQMIYVQHVPNNYMPSVQTQMDPNQMYFQQAYQQIVPQPVMAQGQDMRQYHVNMLPANMVQSPQNIGQNVPAQAVTQNDRTNEASYIQMPANIGPNMQIPHVNSPQIVKQQTNTPVQSQQMINQRHVYQQQINQQVNVNRPQLITVNPMQQGNLQAYEKPQNNVTVNQQVTHQMYANTAPNPRTVNTMAQTETRMRKITPSVSQIPTNVRSVAPSYMYRPIQPRPPYRHNMPNINVQNTTTQIPNVMNLQPIPQNANQVVRKMNDEMKSRKRKSESPDKLHNKVTVVNINTAVPSNPIRITQAPALNTVKSVEIGVNTSPVHRPKAKVDANKQKDPRTNIIKNEDAHLKETVKQNVPDKEKEIKSDVETNAAEKIRYTVFPQARVRPPQDEFNKVNVNILKDTKNILYSDDKNEIKLESKSLLKEKILSRTEIKKEIEDKSEIDVKANEEVKDTKTDIAKDKKEFVLTHVLDGIVIQESNTAFPIREPVKVVNENVDKKRDVVKVDGFLKGNCLELPISDLKLKDKTKEDKDNPFIDLKTATVKSWTVDELCSHLAKYNWNETVTLLQEHEIDGESLLLVSKAQLLHIGVKEKNADIICEFVKS
ncbi:uncharacterized protein LOC106133189 [Amyelois transitella]|uniref:uncharacterized protein LOC106133189 n=1 Tax=Amyelois transitella TaxID=680683 RepID=UPI00067B4FA1|nr:uncharacterized protein LOC106133189 [Amyelois transitella]